MITCFPKKCNPHVAKCGYKRHHYWVAVGFVWFLFILAVQIWCSFAYCTTQKTLSAASLCLPKAFLGFVVAYINKVWGRGRVPNFPLSNCPLDIPRH